MHLCTPRKSQTGVVVGVRVGGSIRLWKGTHSMCDPAQILKYMEGAIYLDSGLKTMFFKEKWYTTIMGRTSFWNKQLKQPFINISSF